MGEKAIREIRVGRRDMNLIPVHRITVDKTFNVRDDYGDIEGLAKDIAQNGLHFPLKVRLDEDKVVLVDGHRRLRAIHYAQKHLKAPLESVYCLTENKGSNEDTRILEMFSTGSHTKPLTPLEQARALKRLIDLNWSVSRIAGQTGFGEPKVRQLLDLNGASAELRQAVSEEKISTSAAVVLAKAPAAEQKRVLAASKGEKVKVSDVHRQTIGKSYTVSTTRLMNLINNTKEVVKKRRAAGRPTDFAQGVRYGLMVAVGKKKFTLTDKD
jgi:ParB-like chromosome segregation protein Spo0J